MYNIIIFLLKLVNFSRLCIFIGEKKVDQKCLLYFITVFGDVAETYKIWSFGSTDDLLQIVTFLWSYLTPWVKKANFSYFFRRQAKTFDESCAWISANFQVKRQKKISARNPRNSYIKNANFNCLAICDSHWTRPNVP